MSIIKDYQGGVLYLDMFHEDGYSLESGDEFINADGSLFKVLVPEFCVYLEGNEKRQVIKSAQLDREIAKMNGATSRLIKVDIEASEVLKLMIDGEIFYNECGDDEYSFNGRNFVDIGNIPYNAGEIVDLATHRKVAL